MGGGSRKGKNAEGNSTKLICVPLVRTGTFMSEATPAFPGTFPFPCFAPGPCGPAARLSFHSWTKHKWHCGVAWSSGEYSEIGVVLAI